LPHFFCNMHTHTHKPMHAQAHRCRHTPCQGARMHVLYPEARTQAPADGRCAPAGWDTTHSSRQLAVGLATTSTPRDAWDGRKSRLHADALPTRLPSNAAKLRSGFGASGSNCGARSSGMAGASCCVSGTAVAEAGTSCVRVRDSCGRGRHELT